MAESTFHKFLKREAMRFLTEDNNRFTFYNLKKENYVYNDDSCGIADISGYLEENGCITKEVIVEVKVDKNDYRQGINFKQCALNILVVPYDFIIYPSRFFEHIDMKNVMLMVFDEYGKMNVCKKRSDFEDILTTLDNPYFVDVWDKEKKNICTFCREHGGENCDECD